MKKSVAKKVRAAEALDDLNARVHQWFKEVHHTIRREGYLPNDATLLVASEFVYLGEKCLRHLRPCSPRVRTYRASYRRLINLLRRSGQKNKVFMLASPKWIWWKTMTPGIVRPFADYLQSGTQSLRFLPFQILSLLDVSIEEICAVFHRTGHHEQEYERWNTESAPPAWIDTLSGRYFYEDDYESWVLLSKLAGRPIHFQQGIPPFRDCESYRVFTVNPDGTFFLAKEDRTYTLDELVDRREEQERQWREREAKQQAAPAP